MKTPLVKLQNFATTWKSSRLLAVIALLLVTAIWGSTFIVVKNAIAMVPVMDFLWIRFSIAALVMIIIRPTCLRHFTLRGVLRGIILGIFLGAGYITQTFGLETASATISGFITGMFVVFTPLISWLVFKRRPNRYTWLATILVTAGLAFLGLRGWSIGVGEFLTLLCALSFAIHIVGLGKWASSHNAYGLALLQIATVALISLIASVPQGLTIPLETEVWVAIGITAILASAFAFIVQTWAQSLVTPVFIAIIMTMEPVFAGIFGIAVGGEPLTWRIMTGAALILAAMLLVQLKQEVRT